MSLMEVEQFVPEYAGNPQEFDMSAFLGEEFGEDVTLPQLVSSEDVSISGKEVVEGEIVEGLELFSTLHEVKTDLQKKIMRNREFTAMLGNLVGGCGGLFHFHPHGVSSLGTHMPSPLSGSSKGEVLADTFRRNNLNDQDLSGFLSHLSGTGAEIFFLEQYLLTLFAFLGIRLQLDESVNISDAINSILSNKSPVSVDEFLCSLVA